MNYLVIYQKHNGDIIYRTRRTQPYYQIGNTTSMGWLVLDIKRMDKGKTYTRYQYSCKLDKKESIRMNIRYYLGITRLKQVLYILLIIYMIYTIFVKLK